MINTENAVAALYMLFSYRFPEDARFWTALHDEELDHARDIATDDRIADYLEKLPAAAYEAALAAIQAVAHRVRELTEEYARRPPSVIDAYLSALQIEKSAGEFHMHEASRCISGGDRRLLARLGKDDLDHAERIRKRLEARRRAA